MTTIALVLVILALAACQPSRDRTTIAAYYAVVNAAHLALVSWWVDGTGYYLSAAVADVLIMWMITQARTVPTMAVSLLRACLAELIVNAAGWVLWWYYMGPELYNSLYWIVQVWIVAILMTGEREHERGGYTVGGRLDLLRLAFSSRRTSIQGRG